MNTKPLSVRPSADPSTWQRMPALFIGHGNPLYTLGHNPYAAAWQQLGEQLPRPKARVARCLLSAEN